MTFSAKERRIKRSLKAYSWYVIFTRAYFWTPLFVLYFTTTVTLKQVFQLEAIYYASVFLLEVPSGYFSDFYGRKKTLIISSFSLTVSYFLFFLGGSFTMFAIAQFFLAIGFSFASGTDTSLHYGLLNALNKEKEYGDRESKLASWGLLSVGAAAIIGGLFAWISEFRIAYALSGLFAFLSLCMVMLMIDPDQESPYAEKPDKPLLQIKNIILKLKDPALKYLFVFTILMTVLNHIPYELYQVYINNMLIDLNDIKFAETGPLVLGFHTALSMIIASFFAKRSMGIEKRFGTKGATILTVLLISTMIAIMGVSGSFIIVVLLLLRGLPSAISNPIVRAGTTHKLSPTLRATYYSTKSLLGRISFSVVLLLFSLVPGNGFNGSLLVGTVFGIIALIVLVLIPIKEKFDNR